MKQGWKTCKFADVFDLQMGKTPSRDDPTYWGDDNLWVSIADMNEQKYMSATKEGITDIAVQESGIKPIPKGTVIMSFKLSIGKVSIATSKLYTNEAIMGFIEKEEGTLVPEYLYYYLKGYKWEGANKAAMGMTLNKKTIAENTISYPPVVEQEKIVAELDCLSGIIEKKKQQLKELDNLAQSIFYEMFGDPNTNDKSWELIKVSEICENLDYRRKPITAKDRISGQIPYYGASGIVDYVEGYIFDGRYLLVSEDGANLLMRNTPIAFTILGKTWVNNHAHVLYFDDPATHLFVEHYLNLLDLSDIVRGCAQPKLTQASLNDLRIFKVNCTLQQEFASKIEAIEKQKELIAKSIKETETLFNSRMDYYFN